MEAVLRVIRDDEFCSISVIMAVICHQFYFSTNLQGVSKETSRSWVPRYFINGVSRERLFFFETPVTCKLQVGKVEMVDSGLVCLNGYILPCQCSRGG